MAIEEDYAAAIKELSASNKDRDAAKAKIAELEATVKERNDEAKRNRLTGEGLKTDIDRMTKREQEAKAEHEAALAKLTEDLTGKLTATEQRAAEREEKAKAKAVAADLRVAAKDAGMIDLDLLRLIDGTKIEIDDNGDVKNAKALIEDLKKSKPYAFGNGSTSSSATPPKPTDGTVIKAKDMTPEQRRAGGRALGIRGPIN